MYFLTKRKQITYSYKQGYVLPSNWQRHGSFRQKHQLCFLLFDEVMITTIELFDVQLIVQNNTGHGEIIILS